jgi:hypothetical protein
VEEIAYGITREWLFERRIVVYAISLLNVTTLRIWANEVMSSLESWSKERPYLVLHDLSMPGIGLSYIVLARAYLLNPAVTSFGSEQLRKIMEAFPDFRVYLAVVLSQNYAELITPATVLRFKSQNPRITTAIFFDRPVALQWLVDVGIQADE